MATNNQVILTGFLAQEPVAFGKSKENPNKPTVLAIRVSVKRPWRNPRTGDEVEYTDYIDVKCFGPWVEYVQLNLKNGDKVAIQGHVTKNNWVDKEGKKRSELQVVAENIVKEGHVAGPKKWYGPTEWKPLKDAPGLPKEAMPVDQLDLDEEPF